MLLCIASLTGLKHTKKFFSNPVICCLVISKPILIPKTQTTSTNLWQITVLIVLPLGKLWDGEATALITCCKISLMIVSWNYNIYNINIHSIHITCGCGAEDFFNQSKPRITHGGHVFPQICRGQHKHHSSKVCSQLAKQCQD